MWQLPWRVPPRSSSEGGERHRRGAAPTGCEVRLRVANSLGDPVSDESRITTGLGTQLMSAFAMQLDAKSEIGERDGAFVVNVVFKPSEFAEEP